MSLHEPVTVAFTNYKGLEQQQNNDRSLWKMSTFKDEAWDAMVTSVDCIDGLDSRRCGVSCRVAQTNNAPIWMIGLTSTKGDRSKRLTEDTNYGSITHAAYVQIDTFKVYEDGSEKGTFGHVKAGDVIKVVLNSETPHPKIEYRVNDQVRYTSQLLPIEFPFAIKLCAYRHGPAAEDVKWIVRDPDEVHMASPRLTNISRQALEAALQAVTAARLEWEVRSLKLQFENDELRKQLKRSRRDFELGSDSASQVWDLVETASRRTERTDPDAAQVHT